MHHVWVMFKSCLSRFACLQRIHWFTGSLVTTNQPIRSSFSITCPVSLRMTSVSPKNQWLPCLCSPRRMLSSWFPRMHCASQRHNLLCHRLILLCSGWWKCHKYIILYLFYKFKALLGQYEILAGITKGGWKNLACLTELHQVPN